MNRVPDASPETVMDGSIQLRSDYGKLVYTDFFHQDDDGVNHYKKAVLVDRSSELPPADADADGVLPLSE